MINILKSRIGFLSLFLLTFVLSGCATTGSGDPNAVVLQGNTVSLTIARDSMTSRMDERTEVMLRRLVRATEASRTDRIFRPSSMPRSIASLVEQARQRNNGYTANHFIISREIIAVSNFSDSTVQFDLPETFDPGNDCFVAVTSGSTFGLRIPGRSFSFSLAPYEGNTSLERDTQSKKRAAISKQSQIDSEINTERRARNDLRNNRAFKNGACVLPPQRALPSRPRNALPYGQAQQVAEEMIIQHLINRYVGTGDGCGEMMNLLEAAGLGNAVLSFLSRHSCAYQSLSNIYPIDEFSPFADFFEERFIRCAVRDEDWGCALLGAAVIGTRFVNDRDILIERLNAPYRRYQSQVSQIRAEPGQLQNQCVNDTNRIRNHPQVLATLEQEKAAAERDAQQAELRQRSFLRLRAETRYTAGQLACSIPDQEFLNDQGYRVFGAVPKSVSPNSETGEHS